MKAVAEKIRKYYKYGTTPNVNIVGSPTINNGVVSGFSSSNYLMLPYSFMPEAEQTWEIVFKLKLNSSATNPGVVIGTNLSRGWNPRCMVHNDGVLKLSLTNTTNSWSICDLRTDNHIDFDTWYKIKWEFTGTSYNIKVLGYWQNNLYIEDEELWVTYSSTTAFTAVPFSQIGQEYDSGSSLNYPFEGSIDLTESYIKINGKDWWHGTFLEEATESDYDFYKDIYEYSLIKQNDIYKAIKSYEKGQYYGN